MVGVVLYLWRQVRPKVNMAPPVQIEDVEDRDERLSGPEMRKNIAVVVSTGVMLYYVPRLWLESDGGKGWGEYRSAESEGEDVNLECDVITVQVRTYSKMVLSPSHEKIGEEMKVSKKDRSKRRGCITACGFGFRSS